MQTLQSVKSEGTVTFRKPLREDGAQIWELIRACKPLDENSMYANLLQADHFRDTCVVAELDGEIVGWISAYLLPSDADTVFVWQVAVSSAARGMGMGTRMLDALMLRDRPGTFAAGEMLDWEAPTGGYLLTACLATGAHAGRGAAAWATARG